MATFELAGFRAGKTVTLGDYRFVKGRWTYEGNDKTHEEFLSIYLERNFYAFLAGSPELAEANARYAREQKTGLTEVPTEVEPDEGVVEANPTVKEAVGSLDAEDDGHWTAAGLPNLDAVSDLAGEKVTRQQVETAAPGYNRAAAKAAASI